MDVYSWTFILIVHVFLLFYTGAEHVHKSPKQNGDDKQLHENKKKESVQSNKTPVDYLTNPKTPNEPKDYFLPPIFPDTDDGADEEDDEIEDEGPYDYEYDSKEPNYKDSPDMKVVHTDPQELDKIPLHSAKDNLPIFLAEPENTYVVKNKPATLKCRAANALEIYFKCNGIKMQALNFEFVDPHTGVRIVEGEYNVTREQVEEYFGTEKYQCSCFAWTSRGHIRSQAAFVEMAYIKKQFTQTPQSQLVKQNTQVMFRCEPPPAAPFAQIYWLKNGAPMLGDDNTQIIKEGQLIIKQATLLDMANYTCVAENLAGKRISESALLTVFVNGGWTAWSSWTDCSCDGSERNGRRRTRSCTAPRPLNGGQPCMGPAVQKTQDCVDCDLDLYVDTLDQLADESTDILLGRWSQWSEWSRCDTDCLQTRRRRCVTSAACLGKDYQVAQCALCVRTSKSDIVHDVSSYWPLLIALSILFLVFIVIVVLGIKYLKLKINEPYMKSQGSGSNYFGNVIKRTLTNQPDLTIHEEFQTMDSRRTHRNLNSSISIRNEHLYEVPQLANSYITPIDQEVRTVNSSTTNRNYACKEIIESDHSDSSCFLSSASSYGNESVEMSPSLKNNISIDSRVMKLNLETSKSGIVTSNGDWLNLEKCGVSLYIPDGTIDNNDELFSVEVIDEDWLRPVLQEGETQLSPIIRCGPKNSHFSKSVVLTFPHCASLKNNNWMISLLQKHEDFNTRDWRRVLTLGHETPGSPLFVQLDPGKVYLVSEFLSDFVLVGRSFSGLDSKFLRLALFLAKKPDSDGLYNLRVHVIQDTPYAFYGCLENEKRLGGTQLCNPKTLAFQENCSDLCFNLKEIGIGWKVKNGTKYQELSYDSIWANQIPLSCDFILEQIDAINRLELSLFIYQKQKQSNNASFSLKTNEINSNLPYTRYSYSESGTVNILENPFHYSSLSKKEGRYDFVYRNTDSLYRSSFSLDNNCRTNALTKSDRVILCKLLDVQTPKGNDWRLLAEKLKVNGYYYYFSNTCSPTENILNLWMCRNNDTNMLVNLARIFRDISRIDCATVIERRCYPNNK